MLLTKEVEVRVTSKNKEHYASKGYDTSLKVLKIPVDDLPSGSRHLVSVKCDYCGETTEKNYKHYLNQRTIVKKDACRKCTYLKEKDIWGEDAVRKRRGHCKGRLVYSYEFVKECVESEGFIFLTKKEEYVDFETKIKYLCGNPNHKPVEVRARAFVTKNNRCQACYLESLKGENSPLWKGGKRETKLYFRGKLQDWTQKSFELYNYTCPITNITGYSEVHHIRPFVSILDEAFSLLGLEYKPVIGDYEQRDIKRLVAIVQDIHEKHLGVPLYRPVHKMFHTLYGISPSESDYFEFAERCRFGDLKDQIDELVFDFNSKREHDKEYKKVICLETGIVYDTKAQASRETGIPTSTITRSIKNNKPYRNLTWMRNIDFQKNKTT